MKVELSTEKIQTILAYTHKYVGKAKKDSGNIYSGIQLLINNNNLVFLCLNGEQGLRCNYGEVKCDDISVTIDYWSFSSVVNSIETDVITLTFDETKLKLTANKSKYSFAYGTSSYDHAFSYPVIGEPIFSASVEELSKVYKSINGFIADNAGQLHLQGILYDGVFASTDGNTLAVYTTANRALPEGIFISKATYDTWLSYPNKTNVLTWFVQGNILTFTISTEVGVFDGFTQLMTNKFPAYKSAVSRNESLAHILTLSRNEIAKAVKRLSPLADVDDLRKVVINVQKEAMTLTCASLDGTQEGSEEIQLTSNSYDGSFDVTLNLKKLNTIVNTTKEELLSIALEAPDAKMIKFNMSIELTIYQMALKKK